ncbi:hypothetical protein, partial [Anaerotignum lactatifermentans]|uniref:hypothetical protein n=1 Tax=Anaerotignum lactatifermentans TaxID=160404 RepID=UPI003AEFF90D
IVINPIFSLCSDFIKNTEKNMDYQKTDCCFCLIFRFFDKKITSCAICFFGENLTFPQFSPFFHCGCG